MKKGRPVWLELVQECADQALSLTGLSLGKSICTEDALLCCYILVL